MQKRLIEARSSGGHGFGGLEGLDCLTDLTTEFYERGETKNLDPSRVKNIRRPGFQLKINEPGK